MEEPTKTRLQRRNRNRKLRKAQGLKIKFLGTAGELRSFKSDLDLSYYRIAPEDSIYRVTGGTSPHILIVKPSGELHCNCRNTASPCSHVLCYQFWIKQADALIAG